MMIDANKYSVMTLFSKADDPYSHKIRIVLAEKDVTFEIVDVDQSSKIMKNLFEYNPYSSIPTLIDRDLVLYQPEIIMEYLDERFPHPPLMPAYPVAKGRSRLMIYRINEDWYKLVNCILESKSNDRVEFARRELINKLRSISQIFSEMPYFLSQEFSLVDCCIAPILWRLPKLGIHLSSCDDLIASYANRIFQRETFQTSLTEIEKSLRVDYM